jgi:carboxyl-terminal processing protease
LAAWTVAAFVGGAMSARTTHATSEKSSPYAPLSRLARVLVFVENQYVDPVDRQRILDGAVRGMVAELDPHSTYMDEREFSLFNEDTEGTFGGIGVEVDFKDDYAVVLAPIPSSPAMRAGVRAGDKIIAVDNKLLRGLSIDKIVRLMRGPAESRVRISIKRQGVEDLLHFDLVREHIHVRSVESKRLRGEVGYVRLRQFQQGTHQDLLQEIAKLRRGERPLVGVLLDMRNNPGGLIDEAEAVADEFLAEGVIYTTRHRGSVLDEVRARRGGALTALPVVLLVNEYSASSAELVAGALQDNRRATIVGQRTFGKGSVQTIFELPGGAGLRLTTMRYYTPSGQAIQAAGITPDVAVQYRDEAGADGPIVREGDLEGHLAAEQTPARKSARVVVGGKAPVYTPLERVPDDPAASDADFALKTAHETLLGLLAAR